MPVARRYFAPGQLQFITSSVYRRLKLFDSQRLRLMFVELLREYRQENGFLLIGWVLMPEHFHLLIKPEPAESSSRLMQEQLKTQSFALRRPRCSCTHVNQYGVIQQRSSQARKRGESAPPAQLTAGYGQTGKGLG